VFVVAAVILSARFFFKDTAFFHPIFLVNTSTFFFERFEGGRGFLEKIKKWNKLAKENDELMTDIKRVASLEAKIDELERENLFLRKSTEVIKKSEYKTATEASIFNLNLSPNGYNLLLNKGSFEGISEGDMVITTNGSLVGNIQDVQENFSRVLFVLDKKFKVTVKVLNNQTSGIARGATTEGMYLDLIVQEDEIKEGDILISTGDDLFPSALVVGEVEHVDSNETQMFKKVKIKPAINEERLGRVLVIKKHQTL